MRIKNKTFGDFGAGTGNSDVDFILDVLTGGATLVGREIAEEFEGEEPLPAFAPDRNVVSMDTALRETVAAIQAIPVEPKNEGKVILETYRYWGKVAGLACILPQARDRSFLSGKDYLAVAGAELYKAFASDVRLAVIKKAWEWACLRKQSETLEELRYSDVRFNLPFPKALSQNAAFWNPNVRDLETMRAGDQAGDHTGNALRCTDFDFSWEDIAFAAGAEGWWEPLSAYTVGFNCKKSKDGGYFCQNGPNRPKGSSGYNSLPERNYITGWLTENPAAFRCGPGQTHFGLNDKLVRTNPADENSAPVEPEGSGSRLYQRTGEGGYVVNGYPFCRYNPKNWRQERVLELSFLSLLQFCCEKYLTVRTAEAWKMLVTVQTAFVMHKTCVRNQWVTPVPMFFDYWANARDAAAVQVNGRYEYQLGNWRTAQGDHAYYYVPKGVSQILEHLQYFENGRTRWHESGAKSGFVGPERAAPFPPGVPYGNSPSHVAGTAPDTMCTVQETTSMVLESAMALSNVIKTFGTLGIADMVTNACTYATQILIRGVQAATGGQALTVSDFWNSGLDPTGFAQVFEQMYAIVSRYSDTGLKCVKVAEANLWLDHPELKPLLAQAWLEGAKEVLALESMQKETPASAIATVAAVTPAKTSGGGFWTAAGAGAGFLFGGPAGAVAGAVVGSMLTAPRATAAAGPLAPALPADPMQPMNALPPMKIEGAYSLWQQEVNDTPTGQLDLYQIGNLAFGTLRSGSEKIQLQGAVAGNTFSGKWSKTDGSTSGRFVLIYTQRWVLGTDKKYLDYRELKGSWQKGTWTMRWVGVPTP